MFTLMLGNPNGGYESIETFSSYSEALEFAKEEYPGGDWYIEGPSSGYYEDPAQIAISQLFVR